MRVKFYGLPADFDGVTWHCAEPWIEELLNREANPFDRDSIPTPTAVNKALMLGAELLDGGDEGRSFSSPDKPQTGVFVGIEINPNHVPDVKNPHVTMCYLGKTGTIDRQKLQQISDSVTEACREFSPFELQFTGLGVFKQETQDVHFLMVTSAGLNALRQRICDQLTTSGVEFGTQYGFTPHLTLKYVKPGTPLDTTYSLPENCPVTGICLWYGDEHYHFPLTGSRMYANPGLVLEESKSHPGWHRWVKELDLHPEVRQKMDFSGMEQMLHHHLQHGNTVESPVRTVVDNARAGTGDPHLAMTLKNHGHTPEVREAISQKMQEVFHAATPYLNALHEKYGVTPKIEFRLPANDFEQTVFGSCLIPDVVQDGKPNVETSVYMALGMLAQDSTDLPSSILIHELTHLASFHHTLRESKVDPQNYTSQQGQKAFAEQGKSMANGFVNLHKRYDMLDSNPTYSQLGLDYSMLIPMQQDAYHDAVLDKDWSALKKVLSGTLIEGPSRIAELAAVKPHHLLYLDQNFDTGFEKSLNGIWGFDVISPKVHRDMQDPEVQAHLRGIYGGKK